ncbi:DUF2007 domain-containing protein [Methylocapsa acidiphila]|uniref:putative signal transducing protein n=1 Tax=Methylocapsa acidiphila TaxID=133552 RepID=UPI0009FFD82E
MEISECRRALLRALLRASQLAEAIQRSCRALISGEEASARASERGSIELLRTNDLVLISRIEAILFETGIAVFVADRHMSAVEGSLGFLPRRLMIDAADAARARAVLTEAGLGEELPNG